MANNMISRIAALPKKIALRISNYGARDALRCVHSHIDTLYREKKRRVDTRGRLDPSDGAVDDCHGYEPISYECLDRVFESIEVSADDVLLDYGSGKGRVLIEAAEYPFKRLIGVEYDEELVASCTNNINSFDQSLLDARVELHHVDAQRFDIPEDVTLIFLWNSFVGEVLFNVKEKIKQHMSSRSNTVNLVLALPSGEPESLKYFNDLTLVRKIETRFWTGVELYHFVIRD